MFFAILLTSCYGIHYSFLRKLIACQLAYQLAVAHYQQPRAGAEHLVRFRGDERHAHALRSEFQHELLYIHLCTDVDTSCRLIEYQIFRMHQQPPCKYDLLLISAREGLDRRIDRSGLDVEQL